MSDMNKENQDVDAALAATDDEASSKSTGEDINEEEEREQEKGTFGRSHALFCKGQIQIQMKDLPSTIF